jgi:hypothetical protein
LLAQWGPESQKRCIIVGENRGTVRMTVVACRGIDAVECIDILLAGVVEQVCISLLTASKVYALISKRLTEVPLAGSMGAPESQKRCIIVGEIEVPCG